MRRIEHIQPKKGDRLNGYYVKQVRRYKEYNDLVLVDEEENYRHVRLEKKEFVFTQIPKIRGISLAKDRG